MTEPALPANARFEALDALRGLAALAVVLFHYTHYFTVAFPGQPRAPVDLAWGKYGVQLFFAISGFVIFMTLERTRRAGDFILSRFARLFPAYWAAVAITTLAVAAGGLTQLQVGPAATAVNLTMLQSLLGVPPVDGVYWTLAVELSFYACMFGLWGVGALRRIEPVLLGWLALKWLWWLVPGLSWRIGALLVQQYIPFFAIGMLSYRIRAGERSLARQAPLLALALLSIAVIDGRDIAIVGAIVTVIFLLLTIWRRAAPVPAVLTWLGGVSYTLYLLHENIGYVVLVTLERAGLPPLAAIPLAVLLALALAWTVSMVVERPALAAIRSWWRRRAPRPATA